MGLYMIQRSQVEGIVEGFVGSSEYRSVMSGGSRERLVEVVSEQYEDEYDGDAPVGVIEQVVVVEAWEEGGVVPDSCMGCGSSDIEEVERSTGAVELVCNGCSTIHGTQL